MNGSTGRINTALTFILITLTVQIYTLTTIRKELRGFRADIAAQTSAP